MATATTKSTSLQLAPSSAGVSLSKDEFWNAEFEEGWRYELIKGVLVVAPTPSEKERDPNDELGFRLRSYQKNHPQGKCLDKTLPEQTIDTGVNLRRADRVIWVGLGRVPTPADVPDVVIEFVSPGKRAILRDYEEKRDEYIAIKVKEYWVIDRFARMMTVFSRLGKKAKKQIVDETDLYETPLLPGFVLNLAELLGLADDWQT